MLDAMVWACIVLAFLIAFSIGANDAANALGTSYGSGALPLIYLVLIGSVFEFIGAFWCSGKVAGTLAQNIIADVSTLDVHLQEQMMLSASIGSALFIFSAVLFAMPISGTHTVIGALIGAGLMGVNSSVINWAKLGSIIASWFISPAVSILMSFMLFTFVCWTILDHKKSQNARLVTICQLSAFSFLIIAIMIINLLPEKCEEGDEECVAPPNSKVYGIALPLAYFFGLYFCRTFMVVFSRKDAKIAGKNSCCDEFIEVLCFWQNKLILSNLENSQVYTEKEQETRQPLMGEHSLNRDKDSLTNSNGFENSDLKKEMDMEEKTRNLVFKTFRILMLIAATMVCLGHGANDVANSISPLVIVLEANGIDGHFPYAVGSAGISLGLLILGKKVMETVGKKVVQLDFAKGYCAQFASAMSVIAGTMLGMPLSTTHCMVGAIFGIGLANKLQLVKDAYPEEQQQTYSSDTPAGDQEFSKVPAVQDKQKAAEQKSTIIKILSFWIATVPVAMSLTCLIMMFFKNENIVDPSALEPTTE